MKKTLLTLALAALVSAPVYAEKRGTDIIINSEGLQFSSDLKRITLKSPDLNAKQATGSTELIPLSMDKFITYWNPEQKTSDFDKVQPNAILTSIDANQNILESAFIIKSAERTNGSLVLNVQYLTNPTENITPISINNAPAQSTDLKKFVSNTENVSVTVLVDCVNWIDGRC